MDAYGAGFADRCLRAGVDPGVLVKRAGGIGGLIRSVAGKWRMAKSMGRTPVVWLQDNVDPAFATAMKRRRNVDVLTPEEFSARAPGYTGKIIAPYVRPERITGGRADVHAMSEIGDDKFLEYKAFKPFMSESELLPEIFKKKKSPAPGGDYTAGLVEAVTRRLGDKWMLKPRSGYASSPDEWLTPENIGRVTSGPGGTLRFRTRQGVISTHKPSELLAQKMEDISPAPWKARINKLMSGEVSPNEWRVHVQGGRAIPGATMERRGTSPLTRLWHMLVPFRSPAERRAEMFADRVAKSMTPEQQKGIYGLDVGLRRRGGEFLIEGNAPTTAGGSYWIDTPRYMDNYDLPVRVPENIVDYVRGVPSAELARSRRAHMIRAGLGLGGLGLAYGAASSRK